MSYDKKNDEFFAFVDDGTDKGNIVFQIDDTEEMLDYLATYRMKHIDDMKGLCDFLQEQRILKEDDNLVLCADLLW